MKASRFFLFLTIVMGYGLIIGGFWLLGGELEEKVRILDAVVSCVVLTQLFMLLIFPMVNLKKKAHQEVGMMGIHYFSLLMCCLASICYMALGIIYEIPFLFQLLGQLLLLFLLLMGRTSTLFSGEKVVQVYERERATMKGKDALKKFMADLMSDVSGAGLAPAQAERLSALQESVRYLTPSLESEALELDEKIRQTAADVRTMLNDISSNSDRIEASIGRLEQLMARRKNY
ncbi:MAG: hypothetical protein J6W75_08890 [Bacteroidaceae bacterium]|nr:hypothetical protein [Bacteroidaceae bacterium]